MADYKSHLTISTTLGIGYGAVAHMNYGVPLSSSILAGGLCAVAGMLPDVDSKSGRPLQESVAFGAAIVPVMLVDRFKMLGLSTELIVLYCAGAYLAIRFVFAEFLSRFSKHRGMFHSIPAALIFSELVFLLAAEGDLRIRIYKAGGLFVGYMSHLVLDEIYSVEAKRGKVRLKKSFGTALKVFSPKSIGATVFAYTILAGLTYLSIQEPNWMHQWNERRVERLDDTLGVGRDTNLGGSQDSSSGDSSSDSFGNVLPLPIPGVEQ